MSALQSFTSMRRPSKGYRALPDIEGAHAKQRSRNRFFGGAFLRHKFLVIASLLIGSLLLYVSLSDVSYAPDWVQEYPIRLKEKITGPSYTIRDCASYSNPNDQYNCQYEQARVTYTRWRSSQSKSLSEASREYQRRYQRPAPAWFPVWYKWAADHKVSRIDDYDQLEADLRFMREGNVTQIMKNMEDAAEILAVKEGKYAYSSLTVKNGRARLGKVWVTKVSDGFIKLIETVAHLLPDLDILVNWGDEPLIRIPDPNVATAKMQKWETVPKFPGVFFEQPCPLAKESILDLSKYDRLRSKERHDLCNPKDLALLKSRHGRFQNRLWTFNVSFPFLSTVKMTTDQDILFPMRGYQNYLFMRRDSLSWEDKTDSLYWRGSTNGQDNTIDNWNTTHRPRAVFNTHYWQRTADKLRSTSPSERASVMSDLLMTQEARDRDLTYDGLQALSTLPANTFNVSFTRTTFCRPAPGADQSTEFLGCNKITETTPLAKQMPDYAAFEHRFLLDLDGLGMSERYYSLLASNSVVLKQTEWAEWHDEILIPWIHFVPVTLGMKEVPGVLAFLINDPRGKKIARRIARESREYILRDLTLDDQSAFMLRLLFEYTDIIKHSKT